VVVGADLEVGGAISGVCKIMRVVGETLRFPVVDELLRVLFAVVLPFFFFARAANGDVVAKRRVERRSGRATLLRRTRDRTPNDHAADWVLWRWWERHAPFRGRRGLYGER
jgi:hypothetical protein